MDRRPPLGPKAKVHLAFFAVLTVVKTLATVVFAAVLGTALTYLARLTYAALFQGATYPSGHAEQQAVFTGNAQAQVDGIAIATLGQEPSVLMLVSVGATALMLRALADWALSYSAQRAATGVKSELRSKLIERVLSTGGTDTPEGTGATAVLLSRGLDAVDHYYSKTLTAMVSSVVTPLILLLWIALYDWLTALVIVITVPLIPLFMVLIGKTTREDTAKAQRELLRLSDHIVELVKGLPVLVGLGRARSQTQAMGELGESYRKTTMHTLRSAFMSSFWLELITTISVAVIAVFIGLRLVNGEMGLDVALFVLLLAPDCYQPLRDVGSAYHQSEEGVAALRKAQQIIDQPLPESIVSFEGEELKVSDVSVSYPGRTQVLDNVSFSFPHGTTTAITGYSGCGKSTLLGVINGSVAPGLLPTGNTQPMKVSGEVSGTGSVVWVSQSPAFIATTVLNEVALYGFPVQIGSEKELRAAQTLITESGPLSLSEGGRSHYMRYLKIVGLQDFADLAPESLSAGQMRRLAIARTLSRVDALEEIGERVTVLVDEPTAHLDSQAALRVNASLAALAKTGATLLIVTHDETLTHRTDFHLQAVVGPNGTTWEQKSAKSIGWDFSAFKKAITEHAESAQETPPRKEQAIHEQVKSAEKPAGIVRTLKDIQALTGIKMHQAIAPVLLSVLSVCFAVSLTALSGWLIVRAAEQPAMMYLMIAVVGVRFFGLGRASSRYAERLQTHNTVLRAANILRVRAWESAGHTVLSIRSLLRGDRILDHLVGDIDELRDSLPRVVLPIASHLMVMILVLFVTFLTVPTALPVIAIAVVGATFIIPAVILYLDHRADAIAREATSELLRLGVSTMDAAEELRANGLTYLATTTFAEKDRKNVEATQAASGSTGFGQALTVLCWWGAALGTVVLALTPVREGEVSAPLAAIVVLMCTALFETTANHVEALRSWPAMSELVARMRPLISETATSQKATHEEADTSHSEELKKKLNSPITIEIEDISTRWPGMDEPVFTGLNGQVSSGQWLGITGASGSGKTTALATLLGFLPAETGSIKINGREMNQDELRGYAAWCPQSAYIFESSIANNLALASDNQQRPSEQQMLGVLERVGLGDFVRSLPEGLATQVGAGGSYVSGGQRQRIAIARTLLTKSPLLLMDEPTAHLDAPAAKALIAEVAQGTKGVWKNRGGKNENPAVILVSHRADDIAACDRTVLL